MKESGGESHPGDWYELVLQIGRSDLLTEPSVLALEGFMAGVALGLQSHGNTLPLGRREPASFVDFVAANCKPPDDVVVKRWGVESYTRFVAETELQALKAYLDLHEKYVSETEPSRAKTPARGGPRPFVDALRDFRQRSGRYLGPNRSSVAWENLLLGFVHADRLTGITEGDAERFYAGFHSWLALIYPYAAGRRVSRVIDLVSGGRCPTAAIFEAHLAAFERGQRSPLTEDELDQAVETFPLP
jgi:hypothetical protein